jgi:hypothetical protein
MVLLDIMRNTEKDMTKFVNKNFYYNGEYLFYRVPGEEFKRFVARFKWWNGCIQEVPS